MADRDDEVEYDDGVDYEEGDDQDDEGDYEEGEDEDYEPEAASDPGTDAGTTGWSEWVRRNFSAEGRLQSARSGRSSGASSAGDDDSNLSPRARSEATKAAVNGLDRREHRLGITATVVELFLTGIVTIPYLLHFHKHSTSELKTMGAVHVFLIEGLVLGAGLLLGTLLKRRALLGFASLLVGAWLLQVKALSVLGIAFLGFGLWLVVKALKFTNKAGRDSGRSGTRSATARTATSKDARQKKSTRLEDRSAPKPNKRYTPPKPSRPAPKKPAAARAEPRKQ